RRVALGVPLHRGQPRPRSQPPARQPRGSVSAVSLPHDHELRRCMSEEPQSDVRNRADQGSDGEAYGLTGIRDQASGIRDRKARVSGVAATMAIDDVRLRRIRWRCRRGMLENDLVLNRFLDECGHGLTEDDIANLDELLHMTDSALWSLIAGRTEAAEPAQAAFVARLREL